MLPWSNSHQEVGLGAGLLLTKLTVFDQRISSSCGASQKLDRKQLIMPIQWPVVGVRNLMYFCVQTYFFTNLVLWLM